MANEQRVREHIEALGVPREIRGVLWEARAKLIWGSDAQEVRRDLEMSGIDASTVEVFMAICLRERSHAMRSKGTFDLAIGAALLVLAVLGAMAVSVGVDWLGRQVPVPAKAAGVSWALCALAGVYGAFRAMRGLDRIIFGARADGAVDDLE